MKTSIGDWWEVTIAATGTTSRIRVADVRRPEVTDIGANALITYTVQLVFEAAAVRGLAAYDRAVSPDGTVYEVKNVQDLGGGWTIVDANRAPAMPNPQAGPAPLVDA